jgi:hypothetical protein
MRSGRSKLIEPGAVAAGVLWQQVAIRSVDKGGVSVPGPARQFERIVHAASDPKRDGCVAERMGSHPSSELGRNHGWSEDPPPEQSWPESTTSRPREEGVGRSKVIPINTGSKEGGRCIGQHRHGASRMAALRRSDLNLAVDLNEALADTNDTVVQVDIAGIEPSEFADPQAGVAQERHDLTPLGRVPTERLIEGGDLIERQEAGLNVRYRRKPNPTCRIHLDGPSSQCSYEHLGRTYVDLVNACRGQSFPESCDPFLKFPSRDLVNGPIAKDWKEVGSQVAVVSGEGRRSTLSACSPPLAPLRRRSGSLSGDFPGTHSQEMSGRLVDSGERLSAFSTEIVAPAGLKPVGPSAYAKGKAAHRSAPVAAVGVRLYPFTRGQSVDRSGLAPTATPVQVDQTWPLTWGFIGGRYGT